jgi:hypothetical protein
MFLHQKTNRSVVTKEVTAVESHSRTKHVMTTQHVNVKTGGSVHSSHCNLKRKTYFVQCKALFLEQAEQKQDIHRRSDRFAARQIPEIATEEISSVNYGKTFEVKQVS